MAEPFLAEIRMTSFVFAAKGWALCNGQLLPINQNQALFSLLGTTYGGDGRVNFALPNLQGRMPMHTGQGHTLGENGGAEAHTLTVAELPAHTHGLNVASPANALTPEGNYFAAPGKQSFTTSTDLVAMNPAAITAIGDSQAHLNLPPILTVSFMIALEGIFPSQT
ncbi:tail fiber protein [Leifsonia kafniensis]|uniref:Tail fiber protein n=1 Tax=Leifsonia kafniensis TaxID=475957 RepID=A0ABP7KIX1_9MICO